MPTTPAGLNENSPPVHWRVSCLMRPQSREGRLDLREWDFLHHAVESRAALPTFAACHMLPLESRCITAPSADQK
jgi:hypothetical protein